MAPAVALAEVLDAACRQNQGRTCRSSRRRLLPKWIHVLPQVSRLLFLFSLATTRTLLCTQKVPYPLPSRPQPRSSAVGGCPAADSGMCAPSATASTRETPGKDIHGGLSVSRFPRTADLRARHLGGPQTGRSGHSPSGHRYNAASNDELTSATPRGGSWWQIPTLENGSRQE